MSVQRNQFRPKTSAERASLTNAGFGPFAVDDIQVQVYIGVIQRCSSISSNPLYTTTIPRPVINTMHTALIGASRGIGRAAALEILESDPTNSVSLLLRSPVSLKSDPSFVNAIASGRARLVKGDAYSEVDVRTLLESTDIDSVVSTLGESWPCLRSNLDADGL